jgi:hypothetical protein
MPKIKEHKTKPKIEVIPEKLKKTTVSPKATLEPMPK